MTRSAGVTRPGAIFYSGDRRNFRALAQATLFGSVRPPLQYRMPDTKSGRASVLARVPIFSDLSETELKFVSDRAVTRRYTAGELIFSEGDPCPGLYVIESGNVRIFTTSAGGREQVLTVEHAGNSVAELPVFDGGNYPASATAATDSSLLFISRNGYFPRPLPRHPEVASKSCAWSACAPRYGSSVSSRSFPSPRSDTDWPRSCCALPGEAGPRAGRAHFASPSATQETCLANRHRSRARFHATSAASRAEALIHMEGKSITICGPRRTGRQDRSDEWMSFGSSEIWLEPM